VRLWLHSSLLKIDLAEVGGVERVFQDIFGYREIGQAALLGPVARSCGLCDAARRPPGL
jgi:hypothetical protein